MHVPYCGAICPYCDFAKTANFDQGVASRYLERLQAELGHWLVDSEVKALLEADGGFTSVFFGGGTPSLYTHEYGPLLASIRPHLAAGAEVSLEANPDDCQDDRLAAWRELGFNRISLGVQSFQAEGLKRLGRSHDGSLAAAALGRAMARFPNVNADLIYGWEGQTLRDWQADLARAAELKVPHLSLYTLTFESRTPLGRAARRGLVAPLADGRLARYYELARRFLGEAGYDQDEVSNWSRPGATCRHNWLYWSDRPFVGVGAGAHGYLKSADAIGRRYAYPRSDRTFIRGGDAGRPQFEPRDADDWLTEVVGGALRTRRGVAFGRIRDVLGRTFQPSRLVEAALAQEIITIDEGQERLWLSPAEWFRENAWAVEILASFPNSAASKPLEFRPS